MKKHFGQKMMLIKKREMKSYKIKFLGISKVKKKGTGIIMLNNHYKHYNSGVSLEEHTRRGFGVLVSPEMYSVSTSTR